MLLILYATTDAGVYQHLKFDANWVTGITLRFLETAIWPGWRSFVLNII